eukprot:6480128-Amphidinium_carterae.6
MLSPSCFPMSSRYCHECKKFKDKLYKSCQKSGDTAWLQSQLATDVTTKKLFDHARKKLGSEGHWIAEFQ